MSSRLPHLAVSTLVAWMCAVPVGGGLSAQGASTAVRDQPAQIEKGRQVVAQVCATCHTTIGRMVQVRRQTAEQWRDTVYFMISRGAQLMPDEIEAVTAFLAATAETTAPAAGRGRAGGAGSGPQAARADGAAILQRTCQQCHDLATASKKADSEEWTAVVARMTTYGARLTPADQQELIGYLNGRTQ